MFYRYDEKDYEQDTTAPSVEVPGTDISALAAVLLYVGAAIGKTVLAFGLACFVVVAALAVGAGVDQLARELAPSQVSP